MSYYDDWVQHDHGVQAARENVKLLHDQQRRQDSDEQLARSFLQGAVPAEDFYPAERIVEAELKKLPIEAQERIRADPDAIVKVWQEQIGPFPTTITDIDAELKELLKDSVNKDSAYWRGPEADKKQQRYRRLLDAQKRAEQQLLKP